MRREKPAILRQAFKEELAAEERRGESLRRGSEELGVVQRAAEGGGTDEGTGVEEMGELKTGLLRVAGRLDTAGKAAGYVLEKRVRVRVKK